MDTISPCLKVWRSRHHGAEVTHFDGSTWTVDELGDPDPDINAVTVAGTELWAVGRWGRSCAARWTAAGWRAT